MQCSATWPFQRAHGIIWCRCVSACIKHRNWNADHKLSLAVPEHKWYKCTCLCKYYSVYSFLLCAVLTHIWNEMTHTPVRVDHWCIFFSFFSLSSRWTLLGRLVQHKYSFRRFSWKNKDISAKNVCEFWWIKNNFFRCLTRIRLAPFQIFGTSNPRCTLDLHRAYMRVRLVNQSNLKLLSSKLWHRLMLGYGIKSSWKLRKPRAASSTWMLALFLSAYVLSFGFVSVLLFFG